MGFFSKKSHKRVPIVPIVPIDPVEWEKKVAGRIDIHDQNDMRAAKQLCAKSVPFIIGIINSGRTQGEIHQCYERYEDNRREQIMRHLQILINETPELQHYRILVTRSYSWFTFTISVK